MNDWQHQQQLDEQERLEEIERLLDEGQRALRNTFAIGGSSRKAAESLAAAWRAQIEAAIGLTKHEKCSVCGGSGLRLNMAGERMECKGNTVVEKF